MRNTLLIMGLCGAALCAAVVPARAGDRDYYCDESGYRCIRVQNSDAWRRDDHWWSRYDRDERRDYDRDRHVVCDPDGDRCYESRGWSWNYREYYRRHGYHWND